MIRCLIVDDEPLSMEVLEDYLGRLPMTKIVQACPDAFTAMQVLQDEAVDLMFLDINMPGLSGLSLLRSLTQPPLVVFTTAYPEYAVEGFELDVLDYLVKPFSFERFLKAVNKAQRQLGQSSESQEVLLVKADKKLYRVPFSDIRYLESLGDYVKVHTPDKVLVTKERLKNIESKLPEGDFVRIHKSYICPLAAINYLEGNRLRVGENYLPIGQTYKEGVLARLGRK